jgi:hypothetical protein
MLFGVFPGVLFNVTGASTGRDSGCSWPPAPGLVRMLAARMAAGGGGVARLLERLVGE